MRSRFPVRYRATRLREMLDFQGRRRDWLARQVGISDSHLSNILVGRHPAMPDTAERIAAVLHLPLDVLFAPEPAKELVDAVR